MGKLSENVLPATAFLCSIIGILGLFYLAQHTDPSMMEIADISEDDLGDYVSIEGIVCRLRESRGNQFITLCDGGEIDIPLFDERLDMEIGDYASVAGTVSLYNKRLQVQVDSAGALQVRHVVWGVCENGVMTTEKGTFPARATFDGPCGLVPGTQRVFSPLPDGKGVGSLTMISGRVSRVRVMDGFTLFSLFGRTDTFYTHENVTFSSEMRGYGMLCEKDGYEEVFLLCHSDTPPRSESIASARSREEGYPVCVEGTIVFLKQYADTVYLKVRDETGYLFAYVPMMALDEGYLVQLRGTLKGGKLQCFEEALVISREMGRTRIDSIPQDAYGEVVKVSGTVVDTYVGEGFVNLTLQDETDTIIVYLPEQVLEEFLKKGIDAGAIRAGYGLTVVGRIDEYKGQREIVPESMTVVRREVLVPLSSLGEHLGKKVVVAGTVSRIYVSADGHVFLTLTDSGASIEVVFFASVAKKATDILSVREGERIKVWGRVQVYRDKLEIVADGFERIQSYSLSASAMRSPTRRASSQRPCDWRCLNRWGISICTPFSRGLLTMLRGDSPRIIL